MTLVATPPLPIDRLADAFSPHPKDAPPGGWSEAARNRPDALVKTHCCFCGMQCGIQLKVRENRVVGFEPWEEFPFNRGMLCPKGVKRYLQGSHPDRLLSCLERTDAGFAPISYERALDETARRLTAIRDKYGADAIAVFGGASMVSEKASR